MQKARTGQTDFMQLVVEVIFNLPSEEQELFWVQCWVIWNQCNLVLHGGKIQNPTLLNKRAREYVDEFKGSQAQLAISTNPRLVQVWRPPIGSVYKLNFDAAIFDSTRSSRLGVIVRNSLGEVMASLLAHGPAMANSEEAEVLACQKAVEFAMDARFTDLVIKGDNAAVMKAITSPWLDRSRLGHIYDDIRTLVAGFRSCTIGCVKRSANFVAHSLARFASHLDDELVWLEESPPPGLEALYLDARFLNDE